MPLTEKGKRHSAKRHRCVEHVIEKGYPESSAWPICVASVKDGNGPTCGDQSMYDQCSSKKNDYKDGISVTLTDKAIWDGGKKTAISVRDGVLKYIGAEIGRGGAESNKEFTVYRSPATIASAAMRMQGLPLTDEHVDVGSDIQNPIGSITSSDVIDFFDGEADSRLAIKNIIDIKSDLLDTLDAGKKELSLGYNAKLIPHDRYDFEQRDIEPHHLAVVMSGRCGDGCKFIDKKGNSMEHHIAFCDADGMLNLAQVVEIAMALPEAIKQLSLDQLKEVMPKLQEIVASAQAGEVVENPQEVPGDEMAGESVDADSEDMPEEEMKDAESEEGDDKDKEDEKKVDVKDSAEFKDALTVAVDEKLSIIEKAKQFCDVDSKLSNIEIMKAALATEYGDVEFEDSEVAVAFKLLKKQPKSYKDFAGNKNGGGHFDSLIGKTL